MEKFNESYTNYWQERVSKISDGTKIADTEIADIFLKYLNLSKDNLILDMGCSYGRFFELLNKYCNYIIGVDIESSAIEKAKVYPYKQLEVSALEKTPFNDNTFDATFCWATFDCTEQEKVLKETNRILKQNGLFLVTGKNIYYNESDEIAFIAERNAKLKSFPNHFTDLKKLCKNINQFGFKIEIGFGFEFRGDFGLAKSFILNDENIETPFYEYLIILKKTSDVNNTDISICDLFSDTAKIESEKNGFINPLDYFNFHIQKFGNN